MNKAPNLSLDIILDPSNEVFPPPELVIFSILLSNDAESRLLDAVYAFNALISVGVKLELGIVIVLPLEIVNWSPTIDIVCESVSDVR